jgi:hypothetical protein
VKNKRLKMNKKDSKIGREIGHDFGKKNEEKKIRQKKEKNTQEADCQSNS